MKQLVPLLSLSTLLLSATICYGQNFPSGNIYVAASRNAQVYEFDNNFNFISSWTHPSLGTIFAPPGQPFPAGPAGMAFDQAGNLVVAGPNDFCVFSSPGVISGTYPKVASLVTETIIFDQSGKLYTSNGTGGSNVVRQYDSNFNYLGAISLPTGALSGMTFDGLGNLFVASQVCSCIYKVDPQTHSVVDTITGLGNVEGLQITYNNQLLVSESGFGIKLIEPSSPLSVVATYTHPSLLFAHNVTIDNVGSVYVGDFENGTGSVPGDLFKFGPNGNLQTSLIPSPIYGPFQILVAGTVLPHNASQQVPTLSTWSLIIFGLLTLCIGAIAIRNAEVLRLQR